MDQLKAPVTVVCSFGLARTPAQVGMIAELQARGIQPDYVVGTSLGAINAAALATGHTHELPKFWEWIHEELLGTPVRAVAKSIGKSQARRQEAALRKKVRELLPAEFSDNLRLAATDLESGNEVVFSSGDLIDAVMASCALPAVFPPLELDGAHLIDGGLVAGMPLDLVPEDTQTVIVLDAGQAAVSPEAVMNYRWWEVGALAYAHLIRGQAVNALIRATQRWPVVMLACEEGRMLDFTDPTGLMTHGRDVAAATLDALPAELQRGIYGLPSGLNQYEVLQELVVPTPASLPSPSNPT